MKTNSAIKLNSLCFTPRFKPYQQTHQYIVPHTNPQPHVFYTTSLSPEKSRYCTAQFACVRATVTSIVQDARVFSIIIIVFLYSTTR